MKRYIYLKKPFWLSLLSKKKGEYFGKFFLLMKCVENAILPTIVAWYTVDQQCLQYKVMINHNQRCTQPAGW